MSRSGHVGFLGAVHEGTRSPLVDANNKITLLGGNQSDKVSFARYDAGRLIDVRIHPSWMPQGPVSTSGYLQTC